MLSRSRSSRATTVVVAFALAVAAAPAAAADPVLPALPVCVQTDVLPAIGSCTPAPPTDAPAEKPAKKKSSKSGCRNTALRPGKDNLDRVNRAVLCLLNRERTKRGRKKLRSHRTLSGVAERYADQMVREQFFDHVTPDGVTMLSRIKGTSYLAGDLARWSVGENLAWGTGSLGTPKRIVRSWMASPGHRRNILDRSYREIGLGVVLGTPRDPGAGATYVNEFGRRIRR